MLVFAILSICISLDVFVWMLERGATTKKITLKNVLVECFIVAFCNVAMFMFGHVLMHYSGVGIRRLNKFVAILIFMILGNGMIVYGFKKKKFIERLKTLSMKEIVRFAFIGSLDCFLVGMGSYYLDVEYTLEIGILFLIVFCGSFIHYYFGYYNGAAYQSVYYSLCGAIYIVMALDLIFHLMLG